MWMVVFSVNPAFTAAIETWVTGSTPISSDTQTINVQDSLSIPVGHPTALQFSTSTDITNLLTFNLNDGTARTLNFEGTVVGRSGQTVTFDELSLGGDITFEGTVGQNSSSNFISSLKFESLDSAASGGGGDL